MSLRMAWESVKGRSDVSWEQFAELPMECHDVTVDGRDVGAILVIGPEIHACILPEGFGRWCNRRAVRILNDVIRRHGYATTSVAEGNEDGARFVERFGFRLTGKDGAVRRYRRDTIYGH